MTTRTGYWAFGYALQHDWLGADGVTGEPSEAVQVTCVHDPAGPSERGDGSFTYDPPAPPDGLLGQAWFVQKLPRRVAAGVLEKPAADWGRCVVGPVRYDQAAARALTIAGEPQAAARLDEPQVYVPFAGGYVR